MTTEKKSDQHTLLRHEDTYNGFCKPFDVGGTRILLIREQDNIFIIENRCGHFGVALDNGRIENNSITCRQHGAQFDLISGQVINHVVQSCDPIRVFGWNLIDGEIVVNLGNKKDDAI